MALDKPPSWTGAIFDVTAAVRVAASRSHAALNCVHALADPPARLTGTSRRLAPHALRPRAMSGAAQQAVGMGTKIVDVLAGGVDSCVPRLQPS